MAIVSAGYDGTVDETQFAKLLNRYSVVGPNDFDATNVAGDRLITISGSTAEPSQALGPGLYDSAADLGTFQFAAATGTRWDLVVLRRDWQPPGGNTSVQIIQGGASKALPGRETNPGVIDDQPLYLQQINGNLLGERIDLRCWAANGGVLAVDRLALDYLAIPGAQVHINGTDWLYAPDVNGAFGWVESGHQSASYDPLNPNGFYFNSGVIEVSGRSRHVAISINRNSPGLTINDVWASFGVVIPAAARTSTTRQFYIPSLIYKNGVYQPCTVFVDMRTGEVKARIESGSITYSAAVSFDVNLVAVE